MGFGTTFATLAFLFIFAGMTVIVIGMQDSITAAATTINDQQQEILKAQQQAITVLNTNYEFAALKEWKITYNDEFNQGTYNNTTATTDQIELTNANTEGTYTSTAYDTGHTSNYTTISWTSIEPTGSEITFQIRSANTTQDLESQPFIGPDETTQTTYNTPGESISDTHNQDQIIQYQATLTATDTSPQLQEITLGVRREVGHATLILENTGVAKLHPQRTDAYIDGIRVPRNQANRVLDLEIGLDERLWNPGQELEITLFTNISTSAVVTIINEYAQTQSTVTN